MGDPKRLKNKYETPVHPWQKERLEKEKSLVQQYGLVNKKEVYKAESRVKKFKDIAKSLPVMQPKQREVQRKQLFDKLKSYNLIQEESLDNVLGLQAEALLDRRLQTMLYKKGLARSVKQARQMITHKHVSVGGKKVTAPGYLVKVKEENEISFHEGSSFVDDLHPERIDLQLKKEQEKQEAKEKAQKKKEQEEKAKKQKEAPKEEKKEEKSEESKKEPEQEEAPKEEASEEKKSSEDKK